MLLLPLLACFVSGQWPGLYSRGSPCVNSIVYGRRQDTTVYVYLKDKRLSDAAIRTIEEGVSTLDTLVNLHAKQGGYDYRLRLRIKQTEPSSNENAIIIDANDDTNGCGTYMKCDADYGTFRSTIHIPTWCTKEGPQAQCMR